MKTPKIFFSATMIAAMFSIMVLTPSCKKEEKDPEPAPAPAPAPAQTSSQKLAGKNWKLTAATVDPGIPVGPVTITDWYAQVPACEKDDLVKFNTDGTYADDEGPSKCNTSDPQTKTGTWVWNTTETIITITENGQTYSFDIVQNDGTTLKYKQTEEHNGINYVFTNTMTKQ